MTRSRFGLLAICAALFGLMAFSAAAHAEVGANWLILMSNGEVLTGAQLNAALGAERDTAIILLTEILHTRVEIRCNGVNILESKLIAQGSISEGRVRLTECTIWLNGVQNKNCTPHTPGDPAGTLTSEKGTGLIKLHELTGGVKDDTVLLLPVNVEMRIFLLEMSELCPIGEMLSIFGEFSVKDCEGKFLTHLVKHLVEEFAPLTAMWVISNTAEHKVTVDGSTWVFLTGEHLNRPFAGDPG